MVLKETRSGISSEENQSTNCLKGRENFIYQSTAGVKVWQLDPIFLQQDALQIPSKPSLDGCSQKQKWWEAILGKVPNSMLNWNVNQCVSC